MLVRLHLHGFLKDKVKKDVVEVDADTLYEALRQLDNNYRTELKAPLEVGRWRVTVPNYQTRESWTCPIQDKDIHVFPLFKTAKSSHAGNWIQMAIGVTLMIASIWLGPAVFLMGLSMFASGVYNEFFAPRNDTSSGTDSKYSGAIKNTVTAGTRIPIGYGLFKVAGQYISYNASSSLLTNLDFTINTEEDFEEWCLDFNDYVNAQKGIL